MALNLESIRKKVAELNGVKTKAESKVKRWKPAPGDHVIRILPWHDAPDGTPFKERHIYYNIKPSWITSPKDFGKEDPIDNFIKKLYVEGGDENKALAKLLYPKLQTCAAIIDRNAEDQGPQLWVMSKRETADVLAFFLDDDYQDITDLKKGFDLKVSIVASAKKYNNKTVYDTKITPKPRSTPASTDEAKLAKWLDNLPNVDEYFQPKTTEEVKAQFDAWVSSGGVEALKNGQNNPAQQANEGSEGTTKGKADTADALDNLVKEISAPAKSEKKSNVVSKPVKKEKEHDSIDAALDDALGDLEDDNL